MENNPIIGHTGQFEDLKEQFERGMISPVYIFSGPASIGKKMMAMEFAKLLNCTARSGKPCRECVSCRKIQNLRSPDVFTIAPQGKGLVIPIDSIRDMKRQASLKCFESSYKVFIIDNADTLTQESANSLLKLLEESPQKTVFILITSKPGRILPTIQSRARIMRFSVIAQEVVEKFMIQHYNIPHRQAHALARFSGGRIGAAIEMNAKGLSDRKNAVIDRVQDLLDTRTAVRSKDWEYTDRSELKEDLSYILVFFRDVMVYQTLGDDRLVFNNDRMNDITRMAQKFQADALERISERIIEFDGHVESNGNMKIIVDALQCELGDMIYAGSSSSKT